MVKETVLSLDLSSKTGWALFSSTDGGLELLQWGRIDKTSAPGGGFPESYVKWAYKCFGSILELIEKHSPTVLVIEQTSGGSKSVTSQKILEWIHFLLARYIVESKVKSHYFLTEEWRRIIECNKMSDADKKRNKAVRDYKKKNPGVRVARDINNKIIGLIKKKHLNVRKANELYAEKMGKELIMDDEDLADALGLGTAYHQKRVEGKL
jgi:hypothetical protein